MPTWTAANSPTAREKRDSLWIRRLRDLNCFDQLVKKLAEGEAPMAVARWAKELNIEGDVGQWSLETWRRYLQVLSNRVRRELARIQGAAASETELQRVTDDLKRLDPDEEADPMCEAAKPVWGKVKRAAEKIDAATALKYAFVQQLKRSQEILETERKDPTLVLTGSGWREMLTLVHIAEGLRKVEIGEKWMRGKRGRMPHGGPHPEELLR